jgi:hypothetical protein
MTTWTETIPNSASWGAANPFLYLLMETGEHLLHEDGEMILIDQSSLASWSEDSIASASWSQKTPTSSSWTKKVISPASWTEKIPN